MTLYTYFRSSAAYRVRIALNLKGLVADQAAIHLQKEGGLNKKPQYRAVNPQMRVPALKLDSGDVLIQSLAIMEYLDETHPQPPLLPKEPRARARVRGLAQIVACDSHPLLVPRVREYLEHELKLDEPTRLKWIHHWIGEALRALESNLADNSETGRFCQGDAVTIADICLVSQAVGAYGASAAIASPVSAPGSAAKVSAKVRPAAASFRKSRRSSCLFMAQPSRAARWMALMIRR